MISLVSLQVEYFEIALPPIESPPPPEYKLRISVQLAENLKSAAAPRRINTVVRPGFSWYFYRISF